MSCYFSLGAMLWVLSILEFVFYMAAGGCVVEERISLMRIGSSLVEANSLRAPPASWGQSDDCCSWERVTCNNRSRVSGLDLSHMYVIQSNYTTEDQGNIEAEGGCWNLNVTIFSSFLELEVLDLYWNYACIQNFDGLQGLTKLRYLNLSFNSLIGNSIFASLGASIEVINIYSSNMNGAIRNSAFGNLKSLRQLHLGSNQLNGTIPTSLFELPRLEFLDLSYNFLEGHVPINSSSKLSPSLRALKLQSNNLNGSFDFFWLQNCTMLDKIYLSGNTHLAIDVKFRGRARPLFQLKTLLLSGCNLDNSIIEGPNFLDTQRHLQTLDLSNNNLTGCIPNWILANVATLVYLNIANNSLAGSLDSMGQYQSNLLMINISMNHFVGQLPTNISSVFPKLTVMDASYNVISGELPPSLCNISSLTFLNLANNKLMGQVPTCVFTDFSALQILKLSNNKLTGLILWGASNLSIASAMYLDSNNFEGALPNNLSGNLKTIDLHGNKLSGELDVSFWNLSELQVLSVASNSLTGEIYPAICKLTGIQFLDMSDNNFEGSIPNCDNKLKLRFLNLSRNTLSGFPTGFFNSSYVTVLDLGYNQFNGSLDWIQCLSQIMLLQLGGNGFEGHMSPSICHLQYLNVIDVSNNKLSGSLPPCIGGMPFGYHMDDLFQSSIQNLDSQMDFSHMDMDDRDFIYGNSYDLQGFTFYTKGNQYTYGRSFFSLMSGIDLSANMLSGEIPWEIGNLSHVKSLNLSHNFFSGRIPATIANMSAIESLDLSHNELSGSIPWQLTQLWSLEVFSVAYNNLSGCILNSGQFGSFSAESYTGNSNLHNLSQGNSCSPVPGSGEEDDVAEACDDPVLYIISAASFVLAFWATVAFMFCHSFGQGLVLKM
ncbi:unnamed protein product [Urochloa humidicola]